MNVNTVYNLYGNFLKFSSVVDEWNASDWYVHVITIHTLLYHISRFVTQ